MVNIRRSVRQMIEEEHARISERLAPWTIPPEALDRLFDAARASLSEVQALTAYQDGKASRLLTNVTFLSALVAAVFTRFSGSHGWPRGSFRVKVDYLLPAATSVAFLVYVVMVTVAVLMVIDAIRPSFRMPRSWTGEALPPPPGSMLFYEKILDVEGPAWAQTFIDLTGADGCELKAHYAKGLIAESYLVAQKAALKISRLDRAIGLLRGALQCLVVFLILFGLTTLTLGMSTAAGPAG